MRYQWFTIPVLGQKQIGSFVSKTGVTVISFNWLHVMILSMGGLPVT